MVNLTFLSNFEKLLSNISKRKPSLCVIKGDFNVRSCSWSPKDINTTEGSKLFSLTSSNGFSQLKRKRHIQTSISSCIYLIFTEQPNLSVSSSVHSSLHPNCRCQIVYSSFDLNIPYHPFPPHRPPYQQLIWDYKKVDSRNIIKALDLVNCGRLFD